MSTSEEGDEVVLPLINRLSDVTLLRYAGESALEPWQIDPSPYVYSSTVARPRFPSNVGYAIEMP